MHRHANIPVLTGFRVEQSNIKAEQHVWFLVMILSDFASVCLQVYITCSVILCESGATGTRCSQGCLRSNSGNHRDKREAAAQTSRHSISQGPLHLAKSSDSRGECARRVRSLCAHAGRCDAVSCIYRCLSCVLFLHLSIWPEPESGHEPHLYCGLPPGMRSGDLSIREDQSRIPTPTDLWRGINSDKLLFIFSWQPHSRCGRHILLLCDHWDEFLLKLLFF